MCPCAQLPTCHAVLRTNACDAAHITPAHQHGLASQVTFLWRGMKNLKIATEFMAELRGGTEVAPVSTTCDFRVAARYGVSDNSLLFKIKVDNVLHCGADMQWLSAFPDEAEVCYPPLTYLQPTGRTQIIYEAGLHITVCEVVPHVFYELPLTAISSQEMSDSAKEMSHSAVEYF